MFGLKQKQAMPAAELALPGRASPIAIHDQHFVLGTKLLPPFPANSALAMFGLGCFWGAERKFWQLPGVLSTSVGYAAGYTPNPTYQEVCSGLTGHNEVVRVVFDPALIAYEALVKVFFEAHNPTQGMRQGNDVGTQYRSGIYFENETQQRTAEEIAARFDAALRAAGFAPLTTEIIPAPEFYYAEDYHQQYLAKNPGGYCGLGGTGVACP
jgi:peptide-methionine (S)-S-oxide reductase